MTDQMDIVRAVNGHLHTGQSIGAAYVMAADDLGMPHDDVVNAYLPWRVLGINTRAQFPYRPFLTQD